MPFTDAQKHQVRQQANWRCCVCQIFGIDVHHIVPEEDGGASDLDNAAPLCPTHHALLGHNKRWRTHLREARDQWYEEVAAIREARVDAAAKEAANDLTLEQLRDPGTLRRHLPGALSALGAPNEVVAAASDSVEPDVVPAPVVAWLNADAADSIACRRCKAPVPFYTPVCDNCGLRQFDD